MRKTKKIIIDDSNEKWQAVIDVSEKVVCLCFEKKKANSIVQGYVDETLGKENIPTGINGLEVLPDDGMFIIDFQDYSVEQAQVVKQPLIDFLTKLYEDNKNKFMKNISKDIKHYEKAVKALEDITCQSCGRYMHTEVPAHSLVVKYGTEADGTESRDYCIECYKGGAFTEDLTIEQMAEKYLITFGSHFVESVKRKYLIDILPNLKRWKNEDK